MLPQAVISHEIPGRLRVKIPLKKGDQGYFSSLKDAFSRYEGIGQIETNALTGSALFVHSRDTRAIAEYARAGNLFSLQQLPHHTTTLSSRVVTAFDTFDKRVKTFTRGELNVPDMAFLVLVGLGVYQISMGNFTAPAWYTAFWYAMNIFLKAQSAKPAE